MMTGHGDINEKIPELRKVKAFFGDKKTKLSELLLKCYECGETIGEKDLQIQGRKYGVTGYFHAHCWEKYQSEHNLPIDVRVRCCDCALFSRCHQKGTEDQHCDPIYCDAYVESENQSSTTDKQPFIPPKNWGGKREKMREQESNLPKDEDSWEMNE